MIRRLARCIREYKWAAILSPLCMIGEVTMEVLIPLVMADLYDYGVVQQNMQVVVSKSILLVLCAIASLSFGVASAIFASKAGTGFAKNLRKDLFYHVQEFSFKDIDDFSSSSLVTRLTSDVSSVQNAFQMIIRMAVRAPLILIFSIVMALRINARMALIFFAIVPFLAIGLFAIFRTAHPIFRRIFKKYDALNNSVQENVSAIRVVKAYVREQHEI